jgi:hypothetical protein
LPASRLLWIAVGLLFAAGTAVAAELAVGPAAKLPSGPAVPGVFRFVAVGDTGTGGPDQYAIARRMVAFHDERPYTQVLLLGDNIYPDGDPADLVPKFEQPYAELLRRGIRFNAVLGNHDIEHERGREAQINYKPFNMGGQPYYSFTAGEGLLEFFALDSNNVDAEQVRWLDRALAGSSARWKIAALHHPLYSSAKRHGSDRALIAALEPLLVRRGVAVAFAGHDHVYERTKIIDGVQYFVSGAGAKLRRGDLNPRSRFFAAGNDQTNSFMFIEVTPAQFAFWSVDASGLILDAGTLALRGGKSEPLPSR